MNKFLKSFLIPKLDRKFAIRFLIVVTCAWFIFGVILRPSRIRGKSMDPTYKDGDFTLCSLQRYRFREMKRGDVVLVRLAGRKIMYLKRIVAMEGETVEFRDGTLCVDGHPQDEPWVINGCDWNLEPRTVEHGSVYVIGDNRSMSIDEHEFGQVSKQRIMGGPLW